MLIMWTVAGLSLAVIVFLIASGKSDAVGQRMEQLSAGAAPAGGRQVTSQTPKATAANKSILNIRPTKVRKRRGAEEDTKPTFRERMIHAGVYRVQSAAMTNAIRVATFALPLVIGLLLTWQDIVPLHIGLILGIVAGGLGIMAPSFWLDRLKARRQTMMRRALPDALDTIIVCMEGGLSLSNAFSRVATELASAHPMLSLELKILEREVRMGKTTGEALRNLARRFDLEELRSLSAVVIQSERYGSSITTALNVFADSLRLKRQQRAEELAHKSAVKIMFPTVLCILPAMFIVILGPAAIKVMEVLLPTLQNSAL